MRPIELKGQNVVYAKDQPEYVPLPAYRSPDGLVHTCWLFSIRERIKILYTGKLYWAQMTFNQPLQPVRPSLRPPEIKEQEGEMK